MQREELFASIGFSLLNKGPQEEGRECRVTDFMAFELRKRLE